MLYVEIACVLLLTLLNGLLAMSEMALVASRRAKLAHLASQGHRGAALVLRLTQDPSGFLSTVQIGITAIGVLAGAFGGATLAERLGKWLNEFTWIAPNGPSIAFAAVVVAITYLSLILGELVPKRIALAKPEEVAMAVARPMSMAARIASPAVALLRGSSDAVLRLLRLDRVQQETVTEEEVRAMIAQGTQAGVFVQQEREMIEGVLRLADRPVRALMTPRVEVVWVDVSADGEAVLREIEETRVSRLLVCEGSVDRAVGVVHAKDLLAAALRSGELDLRGTMATPLVVHERTPALKLLELFKQQGLHMAVVVDEYGTTEGVVTLTDLLEAIAGDLPELGDEDELALVERADGSWLVDGLLPIDEFEDRTGRRGLRAESGEFHTVAGFALSRFGHLPKPGESFTYRGLRFEVADMDGRRIDKLLVTPLQDPDQPVPA